MRQQGDFGFSGDSTAMPLIFSISTASPLLSFEFLLIYYCYMFYWGFLAKKGEDGNWPAG